MPKFTDPPKRRVSASELRRIFNEGGYASRLGQLYRRERDRKHLPPGHQKWCTNSIVEEYLDDDERRVVVVHKYLRPDGTLGGSGKLDPKALIHEGELLVVVGP